MKVWVGTVCMFVSIACGCRNYASYKMFGERCGEWGGAGSENAGMRDFESSSPSVDVFYEYYMCLNVTWHHISVELGYFVEHPGESARVIRNKLCCPRDDREVLFASLVLRELHLKSAYDVRGDGVLLVAWQQAVDKMGPGWFKRTSQRYIAEVSGK